MKKIIVIGAGIGGLSAGIYARKNGYDATLYESHFLPGGMCTAWRRNGFTFEGCLHFIGIVGSSPEHMYYRVWKELGVMPDTVMINHDICHTLHDKSGRTLNLFTDADMLEKELLSLSPADAKEIKALRSAVKRYSCFVRTAGKNPFRFIANVAGILAGIPLLKKYGALNIADYAGRYEDPLIRYAFNNLCIYSDFPCTTLFFFLAGFHLRSSGYPQGSSLAFASTIERTFLELNGKIEYRKKVKRIVVKDGQATGIELDDGTLEKADIIISAADGHATLFDMLDDKFTTPTLRERYETHPVFPPFIQVSLGVNRDMSGTPHSLNVQTAVPFEIAGRTRQALWYQHFAFDTTLAPPGKTPIVVLYPSDLAWWEKLGYASEEYQAEKKKILDETIVQLEQVLPGISPQIETSDVATPFTTLRYTHNWKAGLGFMMRKDIAEEMFMKPQYTLPGLENFYMVGQWVKGLGVPMAAIAGKEVIQKICKADRRKFKAE